MLTALAEPHSLLDERVRRRRPEEPHSLPCVLRAACAPRTEGSSPRSLPCGLAAGSSRGTVPITECQPPLEAGTSACAVGWSASRESRRERSAIAGGVDGTAIGAPAVRANPGAAADGFAISKPSGSLELVPLATGPVPKRCAREARGARAACSACGAGGISLACTTRPYGDSEATLLELRLRRPPELFTPPKLGGVAVSLPGCCACPSSTPPAPFAAAWRIAPGELEASEPDELVSRAS